MVEGAGPFAASVLAYVLGLAVLLYGVYQTAGQSVNAAMAVGGLVVVAATAVLANAVIRIDEAVERH
ncbi:hypothetical protein [Halomicrobium salinisoli]|uniref:hypothetical protein n=1 Tax=Halomicrobium salinisoli TaxID=2878391 RepID=UPI001CEFC5CE|nr:hypothetical protein [Halomicrobium salinisoli]